MSELPWVVHVIAGGRQNPWESLEGFKDQDPVLCLWKWKELRNWPGTTPRTASVEKG